MNPQEYFYYKAELPVIVENAIKNLLTITRLCFRCFLMRYINTTCVELSRNNTHLDFSLRKPLRIYGIIKKTGISKS